MTWLASRTIALRAALALAAAAGLLAGPEAAVARGRLRFHPVMHHAAAPANATPAPAASPDPWGADAPAKGAAPATSGLGLLGGMALMLGGVVVIARGLRTRA